MFVLSYINFNLVSFIFYLSLDRFVTISAFISMLLLLNDLICLCVCVCVCVCVSITIMTEISLLTLYKCIINNRKKD